MKNQQGFVGTGVLVAILFGLIIMSAAGYIFIQSGANNQSSTAEELPNETLAEQDAQTYTSASSQTTPTLSATPTSGVAPISVRFTAKNLKRNSNFVVYFGTTQCEFGSCGESISADSSSVDFTYQRPGTYIAALKNESGADLATATITVGGSTSGKTTLSATPTSGVAPLTVTFVAPPSAGGSYMHFDDGTDGCSVAGAVRDEMGCSVPSGVPFTHTYTNPGTYTATVSRFFPSTILGTATITVK